MYDVRAYSCLREMYDVRAYSCLREYRYMMKKRVCIVHVKVLHKNK